VPPRSGCGWRRVFLFLFRLILILICFVDCVKTEEDKAEEEEEGHAASPPTLTVAPEPASKPALPKDGRRRWWAVFLFLFLLILILIGFVDRAKNGGRLSGRKRKGTPPHLRP
jgi:Na+-transporting methylmalonyl-CoA/oxaloacetate decarboxylase gamma subunit